MAKRAADKAARSYDLLDTPQDDDDWNEEPKKETRSVREMEEDFM